MQDGKFEQNYREVLQFWEAISPHPSLRNHRIRYLWLNTIYEIYLEEFKRTDFEAEVYAAKTRKLIQESSKLLSFKGHLPEIKIDADYLDKLRESKLSPSDKAEKIIRDIETVIRKNEANSAAYIEFQKRLDDLIRKKQEESEAIEQLLLSLGELYSELDEISTLPEKMGFSDKGTFEIYTLIKNAKGAAESEEVIREFAVEVVDTVILKKIYIGWQEIAKEVDRLRVNIEIFASSDKYQSLALDEDEQLMNSIMNAAVRYYGLE